MPRYRAMVTPMMIPPPPALTTAPTTRLVADWYSRERTLARTALIALLCVPPLLLLARLDERTVGGVSLWVKPIKFHVAIAIYLGTLCWYAGWIERRWTHRPWYRLFTALIVACTVVELAWISAAAAVGQPSHFNRSHPVFATLYPLMGVLAVTLTSATLFYAALIARQTRHTIAPPLRAAVIAGLVTSFVLTVIIAGELSSMDSHWIGGTRSDAAGVPLLGWSRDGGDLRVAHFFALHAMQLVPLAASARWPALPFVGPLPRVALVTLAYVAFVLAIYRQALAGEPFL